MGSAEVVAALSSADVVQVQLTITGSGITTPIVSTLVKSGNHWEGMVGQIPVGPARLFHADALDAGNHVIYAGQATAAVVANQQALVDIVMQQVNPPPPFGNSAPMIDSIILSTSTVSPGATLTAVVTAHDVDGDPLTYAWSASAGSFNVTDAASVVWTAPTSEGPQSLTIQVSDPAGAKAVQTLTIQVTSSDTGSGKVTVTVNSWPVVTNVNATPSKLDVGQTATLAVTATDPDGDPLNYAWSARCAGTFSDTTVSSPHFTLSALPTGGACTLTVIASDGHGGQDSGALTIQTGPSSAPIVAPVIDATFQSQATAGGGDALAFRVTAHDPQGLPLVYTWSANSGTVSGQVDSTGTSQITWTSAACGAAVTPTITVVVAVKDSANATTLHTFVITSTCSTCADGIKNGSETDVDCGGPTCGACANGKVCTTATDCASAVCTGGSCAAPTCSDLVKNGNETGTDCGGSCPVCPVGQGCLLATDCASGVCGNGVCVAASCSDGIQNGDETDIDCGGSCSSCATGATCSAARDCSSGVCTSGVCAAASCIDGIKNGGETDVDCGGPSCAPCSLGRLCTAATDCQSPAHAGAACTGGTCTLGACSLGFFNCDSNPATGCETASSNTSCSACGDVCGANQTCQNQACITNAWQPVAGIANPVSIAISPNTFATPFAIYVGTAGNGVFHSSDGTTWASSGPASVVSVASMPQVNNCDASLADGSVQLTANGGATWAPTAASPGHVFSAWYSVAGSGPFGASSNGAGAAQVFQGKSAGAQWIASAPFGTGTGTGIAFGGGASPTAILYVSVSGTGGGVFKSTSIGAASYSFASTGFPQTDVLSVATAPTSLTTVYAGTNGQGAGIYVSNDAGATWNPAGTGLGNTVVKAIAVDPTNAQNVYLGTASGIYVSRNGGATWTLSGLAGSSVTSLAILNGAPNTIYAATSTGLYVTTTGGL